MKKLLIIILILISVQSFGQFTKFYTYNEYLGAWGDSVTNIANRDTAVNPYKIGETRFRIADSTVYIAISTSADNKWMKLRGYVPSGTGTGTVQSVGASIDGSVISVSGSPVTGTGTLALNWNGAATDMVFGNGSYSPLSTSVTAITDPLYSPIGHSHIASDISDFVTAARSSFSSGTGISITDGVIAWTGAASGITSFNGLTGTSQTLAIDTTVDAASWSSVGTAHTLRLPARLFDTTINHSSAYYDGRFQLLSNLSTSTSLGTSNTLYPSQNAVKTYVDAADANNVKLTGNQTINGVKTFNDEVHSYGGFSVVDPNGSLETAFLTYENVSSTYGGGLKLRSTGGNSNTLYAATTLSTNRTNRLPNVTGTLANSVTVNGTNYTSDGNGVIDIGTITSGGSGTVNSGTQYRIGYYAGTGTAISEAPAITGNRALISDANGVPTHSTVTATELAHLVGVTSPIQGQLDSKEAAFLSGSEEFTGSTSMSVTIANTPLSTKEESYYLNGLVIKAANISRVGTTVTFTGFVRESSDIITAKYAYLAP